MISVNLLLEDEELEDLLVIVETIIDNYKDDDNETMQGVVASMLSVQKKLKMLYDDIYKE